MPKARKPSTGPLQGIRIVDLSRHYPGPLATMMMAEMGAEVIKVEDPTSPDPMRSYPPFVENESAGYLAVNRSKRSLTLNLNSDVGRDIFFKLLSTADIVVESFRPGILDELGIGYQEAARRFPGIIYVSVTGYGQHGPYAWRASHDLNYISYSGFLSLNGTAESGPIIPSTQVADVGGGAYMTIIACLTALWARQRSGMGQQVDLSMLDANLPLVTLQLAHYWATGEVPQRGKTMLSGNLACYNVYRCGDGGYVSLAALEPKFWETFCSLVGKPQWVERQFASGEEQEKLKAEVAVLFESRPKSEWVKLGQEHDICLTPVLELPDLERDPHFRARGMFIKQAYRQQTVLKGIAVPLKFSRTPAAVHWPPPALGEDTAAILTELGYSKQEINELKNRGVV